ncbi:MAG: hypothetical protein ACLTKG_00050 [Collinsella intestinalis]
MRGIFDEYVKGGDAAVFAGADTNHVGADESTAEGNAYRKFVNDMFKYSEDNGKKARVWGSLSTIKGDVEVKGVSEDGKHHREMNLWNPGWADLKKMYELGFDLIDCQDGVFYIVPNAGYYYDYLGDAAYTNQLNSISGVAIPAGDPQMVGGAYAVWNDMCDYLRTAFPSTTSTTASTIRLASLPPTWGQGQATQLAPRLLSPSWATPRMSTWGTGFRR